MCCRMRGWHYTHSLPLLKAKNRSGRSATVVEIEDMYLERLQLCHSSGFLSLSYVDVSFN